MACLVVYYVTVCLVRKLYLFADGRQGKPCRYIDTHFAFIAYPAAQVCRFLSHKQKWRMISPDFTFSDAAICD